MEIDDLYKVIQEQQGKIDNIFRSVEKTRKMYLWTVIITLALFIIPLIVMAFVLPKYISAIVPNVTNLGL